MIPGLNFEKTQWGTGNKIVVGMDEVGRGSWAGPLTVGAAVIPQGRRIYKIRDSKKIPENKRDQIYDRVVDWCEHWAVGHASHYECDQLGMSAAQKLAANRALNSLGVQPDAVLLDGKWKFVDHPNTVAIVKGDNKSLSIAAASIIAKVTRDRVMRMLSDSFPGFDFASNKGYPSPVHRQYLARNGACSIHRTSWAFMDSIAS